jgi:hypothetical protein
MKTLRALFWTTVALFVAVCVTFALQERHEQQILRSRYRLVGASGSLGYTELTELRRSDGSRSHLARERMEFWGPALDRFVVLTYDPEGRFDSGHWVGTSEYSPHFTYTFRCDGRTLRGDWKGSVRGSGWSEVPTRPENPLLGFWGPLESLLLSRFDPKGPDRQTFDAVDVEDSHHRLMTVTVEHRGEQDIEVPAGKFHAHHYVSERFGSTHHWVDEQGVVLRWSSENDTYRWDLERYPSMDPLPRKTRAVASGLYDVSKGDGTRKGTAPWSIHEDDEGKMWLQSEERLDDRQSHFEGRLDDDGKWEAATETVDWLRGEGQGPREIQHRELFFHREWIHLLRFRDRAYPLLQSRAVQSAAPFHLVNYPASAVFWLRRVRRDTREEQSLAELAHIANRYRGGGLEVQEAWVRYGGAVEVEGPTGTVSGHRFMLRYPGGWVDSTFEFWTDTHFVPLRLKLFAGEGALEYKLRQYEIVHADALPEIRER